MNLPTTQPLHDPEGLWAMQIHLMSIAEELLGKRDNSKKIYKPVFHENGPHIRNTISLDGAYVELGRGSKFYWPTVVFEMAHETVHLLNPVTGYTNFLEEGVAVEFSIYAQELFGLNIQTPPSGPYLESLTLVRLLPDGVFPSASKIRSLAGSLGAATYNDLLSLFPTCASKDLIRLCEQCIPR